MLPYPPNWSNMSYIHCFSVLEEVRTPAGNRVVVKYEFKLKKRRLHL
ncbi:hypothetical protein OIU77_027381 [Salix suchowensis]|uniref:Uncharacterized protein n=1 Tax=Salix suchowensis TaxID=1278906 RepID=A0ABQ9BSP4_9ROSI|nr:hypothetical protein OIU77_027381 [Salix suchowensis]